MLCFVKSMPVLRLLDYVSGLKSSGEIPCMLLFFAVNLFSRCSDSVCFLFRRHLHSHRNIPTHDSYMWHGNIRCLQGR